MTLDRTWVTEWVRRTASAVASERAALNGLDREIGDGDHGENIARGFRAAGAAVETLGDDATAADALRTAGMALLSNIGGAAGPLYGSCFVAAASVVERSAQIDASAIAAMLNAASSAIAQRGGAAVCDKTMLDAWAPAADAASRAVASDLDVHAVLIAAADAAALGAEHTDALFPRAGRASYLGERAVGHRDPGAASSAIILRSAAEAASVHS